MADAPPTLLDQVDDEGKREPDPPPHTDADAPPQQRERKSAYATWSRMYVWQSCPKQFELEHVLRVPREAKGALIGGIAAHEGVVEVEESGIGTEGAVDRGKAVFERRFDELLQEAGGEEAVVWGGREGSREGPAWWLNRGPEMLQYFHEVRVRDDQAETQAVGHELSISGNVGDVHVRGRLDHLLWVRNEEGEWSLVVRDYKTGKQSPTLQLGLYDLLIPQNPGLTNGKPVVPVFGEIVNLRTQKVKTFHLAPLRGPVELLIREFAEGSSSGRFPMRPSSMCGGCPVWSYCDYGRAHMEVGLDAEEVED